MNALRFCALLFIIVGVPDAVSGQTTTASATYTGTDTTTQGAWTGKYGADGQFIPTDLTHAPAYASVSFSGDSTWVWAASTSDPRALQTASGAASRIAAIYYSNTSFTIDVNLTDGNAHQVSLYLCDFDKSGRSQTISVLDAGSQTVLSTQSFSSQATPALVSGLYASWTVKGSVQIKVAATGVWSAIVNGLFLDSPATTGTTSASATYTGADTTTQGTWTGQYGADGQFIASDLTHSPAYAQVALTGNSTWVWAGSTSDPRALQAASGAASRIASMYYSNSSFTIDVNLTDGHAHKISLYLCDFDNSGRSQSVTVMDAVSKAALSMQNYSSQNTAAFDGGFYATWTIQGHVQIQVLATGVWSAGVNGIFFDTPSAAPPAPTSPTVTLSATPGSVLAGAGSTLTWSSANASACTASGGWSGTETTSGSTSVSPAVTTIYTLKCTGAGGSASASTTVTVTSNPSVDPAWVYVNGQFAWPGDYSFNATPNYTSTAGTPLSSPFDIQMATTQYGGWQPYAPNSAAFDTTPFTSLTFALKPTVANQAWTCYFQINGGSKPPVNVANYGPTPVAGQWGVYTIPLAVLGASAQSIYAFVIQDQSGLAANSWYIDNVGFLPAGDGAGSIPPTVSLAAHPTNVAVGGSSTLTWSSTSATACTASGSWTGTVAASGSQVVTPAATSGYTLTCSNAYGSASATAGVSVTHSGVFSIQVSGNKLVNGAGSVVQMRGVNLSGMEFTAIDGFDPSDPTGGQFGQPNNPNWAAIQSWKANVVRIPLNEASWLGLTCTDTGGAVHQADPGGNYKQALANLVQEANAAGLYVILDLHWAAPGNSCPMLQTQMADSDHSLAFWTSLANAYKNNPAVLFELFNEPFLDVDFSGDAWQYLMFGTGGSFSGYPATGNSGVSENIQTSWNIASYQAMINAVRATGAANVVLIGSLSYTADLSGWLAHKPADPLNQMAASWHPYPTFGTTWGTPAYAQPNFSPEIFTEVQSIQAAGIPVIATETGDQDTAGTVGAPLVATITSFADANGISVLGWTWDVWGGADDVLIQDVNGTPTDGYGVFFKAWMVNHP